MLYQPLPASWSAASTLTVMSGADVSGTTTVKHSDVPFVEIAGLSQVTNGLAITKSDSVAVGDCELRVSARTSEKQGTLLAPRTPVRSTPISANSPCAGLLLPLLSVYVHGTSIGPLFTFAQ